MSSEPIILNEAGDTLIVEIPGGDEVRLFGKSGFRFTKIGVHATRRDDVHLYELTNCNVIVCQELALRIEVPKSIDTYGKLRQHCAEEIDELGPAPLYDKDEWGGAF